MKVVNFKCNYDSKQLLADQLNILFTWSFEGQPKEVESLCLEILDDEGTSIWKSKEYSSFITKINYGGRKLLSASRYLAILHLSWGDGGMEHWCSEFYTAPDYPNAIRARW